MKKRVGCLLLSLVFFLTGCVSEQNSQIPSDIIQESAAKEKTVEEVYTVKQPIFWGEIAYELPTSTVRAMVDRNGYEPDREKYVFFIGNNISGEFRVVREGDWKVVYTGIIQSSEAQGDSRYVNIGMGDFSDVTETGSYYIEQDQVGRSYSFTISENVNEPIFQGLIENMLMDLPATEDVTAADICDVSFGMHSMMLALQCHGGLFEKDNNLVTKLLELAEWLMSFQDETNGSMFDDYEATAAFCGVLTQTSEAFGKYDADVAKDFTAATKSAWRWMEKNAHMANEYPSAQFYACALFYKRDGSFQYKKSIENYLQTRKKRITEDKFAFYGSVIYLNTIKGTDRDLCTKIMQELVDETEEISRTTKTNPYLIYSNEIEKNLQKVLLICFVDYITPSNEYAEILENTLHYLLGRNETGERYLNEAGGWIASDITAGKTMEWDGILLFCLSDLLNKAADDVK